MLIAKVTCGLERFDELGRYDEGSSETKLISSARGLS